MWVGIMGLGSKVVRCGLLVLSLALFLSLASARAKAQTTPCSPGTGVCVLSWQQDTGLETSCPDCVYQTGENLEEPTLTASAIQKENFGVLCSAVLDGQVFGEPLVVTNVTINSVTYARVVYVVTENDTLYAIDGNPTDDPPCQILNGNGSGTSLLGAGQYAVDCNHIGAGPTSCQNTIGPYVGILSTPVIHIDGDAGTIYLVTEVQNCDPRTGCDPETWGHYLHAVNIQTFADQNVQIYPPGQQSGASTFSQSHLQRPGLLYLSAAQTGLTQGTVYVSFSMMDGAGIPAPNGAIFGYPGDLSPTTTPFYFPISEGINQNDGGGIWGAGGPPSFGPNGSANLLYFTTGNSTAGNTASLHDSFLSLNPNLTLPTTGTPYFTPVDQFFRSDVSCNSPTGNDLDFGSGSAMLIPDNALPNWPYLAVNGDKEGGLWFVNRANPGGHNTQCDLPTPTCSCTPSGNNPSGNVQTLWTSTPYKGNTIHTGTAFWSSSFLGATKTSYLYVDPQGGPLSRYTLCASPSATDPICNSTPIKATGYPIPYGATPTISAASPNANSAVVWQAGETGAAQPTGCSSTPKPGCGGTLFAFDAGTLKNLYSNHTCLNRDAIAPAVKFSIPTVANGNVYLGTHQVDSNGNPLPGGMFYIFGLNAGTCS
jgi:hypothetical protein